jgi:prepilin-type N-terminal cleavage/methylation domain-containing protein
MKKGFTLIEIIAVLLLVSMLALSAFISLLPMSQALLQVRENTAAAQKARLAMARIAREFTTIARVVSIGPSTITYDFLVPSGNWYVTRRHTLAWNGTPGHPLMLEGVPLTDDVQAFALNAYDAPGSPTNWVIDVRLQGRRGNLAFSNSIAPRNMGP